MTTPLNIEEDHTQAIFPKQRKIFWKSRFNHNLPQFSTTTTIGFSSTPLPPPPHAPHPIKPYPPLTQAPLILKPRPHTHSQNKTDVVKSVRQFKLSPNTLIRYHPTPLFTTLTPPQFVKGYITAPTMTGVGKKCEIYI